MNSWHFDAKNQMKKLSIESYFLRVKRSIQTLMKKIQDLIKEKHDFDKRDGWEILMEGFQKLMFQSKSFLVNWKFFT